MGQTSKAPYKISREIADNDSSEYRRSQIDTRLRGSKDLRPDLGYRRSNGKHVVGCPCSNAKAVNCIDILFILNQFSSFVQMIAGSLTFVVSAG